MTRLLQLRRLTLAAVAAAGVVVACRAATPGEAPPLGPRPGPVEPSANPVPGAPDPLSPRAPERSKPAPDARPAAPVTMREVPTPEMQPYATPAEVPADAGLPKFDGPIDADLPPVPDAVPTDAAKTLQP
jgi:hypothetical protein